MAWEFRIVFQIFRFALLRREDWAMTPEVKRWAIGWEGRYTGMDGKKYPSWSAVLRLI